MWAAPILLSPPASEPVSLAEAKQFLRIDEGDTSFDSELGGFIAAAREQIEAITGTRLVEQAVELRADGFADLARLPIGPVIAASAIVYDDSAGVEQEVDAENYELFGSNLEQGIRPVFGATWPVGAVRAGAVRVAATVGYNTVPKPIWTAILLMIGDMFAFRETAVTGTVAYKIPTSASVENLLANYRIWL